MILCAMLLCSIAFVHGRYKGKCILNGSTECRYFKVDGSMEKKWDTVIPVDLKTLCKWDTYVPLVTKGLREYDFLTGCQNYIFIWVTIASIFM